MKTTFTIFLIILAVLACGCTTPAPASPSVAPVPAAIPGITGTWTGPMQGYDEGMGFTDYPFVKIVMNVSEQHGRRFSGQFLFDANGTVTSAGFAGVIGNDGKTLSLAEQNGGYCTGVIADKSTIELTYLKDGSPYSAAIDVLKRVSGPSRPADHFIPCRCARRVCHGSCKKVVHND